MKNIIYYFLALALMFSVGCKKGYFDINENPNSPTTGSITPNLILPRALVATASRMGTSYGSYAGWMGYWARSGTYGPSTEVESYNITNTFEASEWSGWYGILNDYDVMEKKAVALDQGFYRAIALVMKSVGFMYLVDQYNNVPYSTAFDLAGNILPTYDKGADIYADLLNQLDTAVVLLKNADIDANPGLADADVMFGGDASMWIKFANTQHLKMALRQSEVSGFDGAAEVAKIVANGGGFLESGETAEVQPSFVVDDGKQNPYWGAYELTFTGEVADQYNRASNFVLGLFMDNEDIRYKYFFDQADDPVDSNNLYHGYNYGEVIPNDDPYKAVNSSDVGGDGIAKSPQQAQWVITSVESLFMQTEAMQRGWLTGDVKAAYEDAVRESFMWLDVEDAVDTANGYLASSRPIVDWDAATDKLELIIMQKYLALQGINNFEAYADYRRLGIPDVPLSLSPSRGSNHIPLRLKYPQDEYNYNAKNVAAEGDIDPQTDAIFWDK